jgi:hypothetical protein
MSDMNRSLGQLGVVYHWCGTKGGARTKTLIAVLLRAMELRVCIAYVTTP